MRRAILMLQNETIKIRKLEYAQVFFAILLIEMNIHFIHAFRNPRHRIAQISS